MVQQRKKSLRSSAKPRRSGRGGKLASETTVKSGKFSKARTSTATTPSRKGETSRQQPALNVGVQIPLDALEAKVTTDDGKKTSLGEQLEKSQPGGLVVFVYPKADDEAYDYASEFDYRQFNYEVAAVSMIGLTPHSVAANAALKEEKDVYFTLLSDPRSDVIKAMNLNISKTSRNVGAFVIDKERTLHAYSCGKKDNVLDQLDRAMEVYMEGLEGS
ncbi:uncharacterized protein A1O9_09716 [Exophiala aquamarina CBS 119918]|uniref:Alkyl hydroperoxide reductase subunit C/ Thiol specific antioxidant domain-containing protein n=1 Tax=Exophiala aquamarina CBS 119918 TaxID=1182545 RepID=A0A072P250_9EURO|nr:uncharacterized protein A1O9_09716 [Exophiala aquamarina CBS 119918]KEF53921.1 hypothetical protein A1O9_09716 [Exophiala aquamarina CBS 119918]